MKMSKFLGTFAIAALSLTAFACSNSGSNRHSGGFVKTVKSALSHTESTIASDQLNAFVKGQYNLNFDIMKQAASVFDGQNAMISTFSIQSALAMTWAGAADKTAEQMKTVLHFDENTHAALNKINELIKLKNLPAKTSKHYGADAVEVNNTNDLYFAPNYTWSSTWLDTLAVNYDAGILEMQFARDTAAATKYINDVVAEDTHNRIQNLLPDNAITADTQFVLTNAIYMKAPWGSEFYKSQTKQPFTKLDHSTVEANRIHASYYFGYIDADNYQAAIVPLRENTFEVMFILPDDGQFEAVQNSLSSDVIDNIFAKIDYNRHVEFSMPTFEFNTELQMSDTLKALGMVDAFVDGAADFSGMTEGKNGIHIAEIYHKSFIAMNENGVEAAAATAVVGEESALLIPEDKVVLDLDRPFFFIIYETDSLTPLFFGRLLDPTN